MRSYIVFLLLFTIKIAGRIFCRVRLDWLQKTEDPWSHLRVLALLNHTSLFEPLLMAAAPNRLLWQIAAHGVIPVADKTLARPIAGHFFRFVARHVVPVTRERDHTWAEVLERLHDPRGIIIILPEGRMKRRTGLDRKGNPMTIRGGIADILASVPEGRMFIALSGGLHHIHAPGDRFPRPFQRVSLGAEVLDIPSYRQRLLDRHGEDSFKRAVIDDLTRRRDAYLDGGWHEDGSPHEDGAGHEDGSRGAGGGSSVEPDALPAPIVLEAPRTSTDHDE